MNLNEHFTLSLGCGTSWHAAGLVGRVRKTNNLTRIADFAVDTFEHFEQEYGVGKKNENQRKIVHHVKMICYLYKVFHNSNYAKSIS